MASSRRALRNRIDPRMPVSLLPISWRLRRRFADLGIVAIGDAARLPSETWLERNFSRRSLRELEELLARAGLWPGMRPSSLPRSLVCDWAITGGAAEEVLAHWLALVEPRLPWRKVATGALGADGRDPRSLPTLARHLGVTKQRVHQMRTSLVKRIAAAPVRVPVIEQMLAIAQAAAPASAGSIESSFVRRQLSLAPFSMRALLKVAEILGLRPRVTVVRQAGRDYVLPPGATKISAAVKREARRLGGWSGLVHLKTLGPVVRRIVPELGDGAVARFLQFMPGCRRLDSDGLWYWVGSPEWLLHTVQRTVFVTQAIRVDDLREGLVRAAKRHAFACKGAGAGAAARVLGQAPAHVLLSFCRGVPGLHVSGSSIYATGELTPTLPRVDRTLVEYFNDHDGWLLMSDAGAWCAARGLGRAVLYQMLHFAPYVRHVSTGFYALRGLGGHTGRRRRRPGAPPLMDRAPKRRLAAPLNRTDHDGGAFSLHRRTASTPRAWATWQDPKGAGRARTKARQERPGVHLTAEPAQSTRKGARVRVASELRRLLQERTVELGGTPREQDLPLGARGALRDIYKSYDRAIRHMGLLPPAPPPRPWTRESVLAELSSLHRRGVRLTSSALQRLDRSGLVTAIYRLCGSMPRARSMAGVPRPPRQRYGPRKEPMRAADLRRMRERYARGGVTQADLAIEYGLDLQKTGLLLRGQLRPEAGGPLKRKRRRRGGAHGRSPTKG